MSERPMTEGEAEALFDKAVDALCEVYGKPMAASILDGRARLLTKEVNDSLGWSPAVQKAMARFQDRSNLRELREAIEIARNITKFDDFYSIMSDAEKNASKIARALLSTSSAERGMRESLEACAAPWDSGETSVPDLIPRLSAEFQRRMNIAGEALKQARGQGRSESTD